MEHAELFLLLPVYEEATDQSSYVKRVGILEENEYEAVISNLLYMSSFFSYENYEGFYDSKNLQAFIIPVDSLKDCYPKVSTLLRRKINNWGSDWRKFKTISDQDVCKFLGTELVDDILCEIANRHKEKPENSYLIVDDNALVSQTDKLEIFFKGKDVAINKSTLEIKPLACWFEGNRRPVRKFHLNPKHGENGKGAHPEHKGDKVSVLLCSREEAEILLNKAVCENAECRVLFFWDADNEKYIEFKCEGNQVFHGFHLDEEDAKSRVSVDVRQKIDKLL